MSHPLLIAGAASGVGKTTVATGIMGALRRRGLTVAPFKVGPDYIDPGYHEYVSGTTSRNLDTWLTSPGVVREIFAKGSAGADVSVVEGVMGLFDGRAGAGDQGSTAEVAELIEAKVLLVVDCRRQARSLAAVLAGFASFSRGKLDLAGAVLNGAGSDGHVRMLKGAAGEAGVHVFGVLPRREEISLPSRHLGLVPAAEQEEATAGLDRLIDHVEEHVDIDGLIGLADGVPGSGGRDAGRVRIAAQDLAPDAGNLPARATLAVARDEAFSFYYADSLEALEDAGARLTFFSPLRDGRLPDCDGLYLGGGFPEMFAAGLEANGSMRQSVASAAAGGLPIYAECGGLIYLCETVEVEGKRHRMSGAVPMNARMSGHRQALGYVDAEMRVDSIIAAAGTRLRGHEFHWSAIDHIPGEAAFTVTSSRETSQRLEGFCSGNVLASYVHLHFAGNRDAAARLVGACERGNAMGVSLSAGK